MPPLIRDQPQKDPSWIGLKTVAHDTASNTLWIAGNIKRTVTN